MMIILKKIVSNEKLILPRLKIFEKIAPSLNDWKILLNYYLKIMRKIFLVNIVIFIIKIIVLYILWQKVSLNI
jgi:hypothetical protein